MGVCWAVKTEGRAHLNFSGGISSGTKLLRNDWVAVRAFLRRRTVQGEGLEEAGCEVDCRG